MIQSMPNNITLTNGNKGHVSQSPTKALLELESNTNLNKTLLALIKRSFFNKKSINWKPVKCELVVNTQITEEFQQIKGEFEANPEAEADEKYAFIIDTDAQINEIALNGYSCQDNTYNVIGQSKSGVYLCKYSDVAMKYSEAKKWPDNLTLKMIVFKICYGKQTLALVRKDAKLPPISATPNFSSHMSVIPPKERDDIETQFDHSQIYLYELNAHKQPTRRPRHCMPYAVITWLKFSDGTEWPQYFPESDADLTMLVTDSLQLALQTTEDVYLQTKLKALLKTNEVGVIAAKLNGDSTHNLTNGDVPHITNGATNGHNETATNGHVNRNGAVENGSAEEAVGNDEAKVEVNGEMSIAMTNGTVNGDAEGKEESIEAVVVAEPIVNGVETAEPEETTQTELKEGEAPNVEESTANMENGEQVQETQSQTTVKTTTEADGTTEPSEGTKPEEVDQTQSTADGTIAQPTTEAPKPDQPAVAKTPTSSSTPAPSALTTVSGPTVSPSTLAALQAHKTSLPHYSKPNYHQQQAYRHPGAASSLYAAAQGLHPYSGISSYQARQMQLGGLAQHPQLAGQGQVFLMRGPNGQMSYVSAGGLPQQYGLQQQQQHHQHQLILAQAQAQAFQLQQQQQAQYQQQQQLQAAYAQQLAQHQAQQAAQQQQQVSQLTYAAGPTQYKQGAPVVQQSQIIYQSAPQSAQAQAAQTQAAKPQAAQAVVAPPPTQSPKQQHAASQFAAAQFQQSAAQSAAQPNTQAAAYQQQQQNLLLQAQTGQSTSTATQQQQQLQLQQQLALLQQQQQQAQQQQQLAQQQAQQQQQQAAQQQQQQQQLLAYQQQLGSAAGGLAYGVPGQAQAGLAQQLGGLQVPAGYQLVQPGYQPGAQPIGLTLEQLQALNGGIPGRARVVNLRHHPYQRNP